jgi:D-alanyl-lipoteichoic acid acyltransferase DltB (MBOAT superfamily)
MLNLFEAWATTLSFSFQIYFDFSGYTDMAIGAAYMFNIKLPRNFNSPYKALNIQDFWRRWHITLSTWLRDYVYIPLGGNKRSEPRLLLNFMIVFLLGGLWHGASWTFVVWGALHGLAMVALRLWQRAGLRMPALVAWFLTFLFINITWVFFRATTFTEALYVLKSMAGMNGIYLPTFLKSSLGFLLQYGVEFGGMFIEIDAVWDVVWMILLALIITTLSKNSLELLKRFRPNVIYLIIVFILIISGLYVVSNEGYSEFLYFQF